LNSVADFCKLIEAPLINVYTQYSDLELDVKQFEYPHISINYINYF